MKDSSKGYFQDAKDDIKKLVPEGIVGRVPYKAWCRRSSTVVDYRLVWVTAEQQPLKICKRSNL